MLPDGQYITIQYDRQKKNQILDWRIEKHLQSKETLGVFAGSMFTKFMCFDVDVKNKQAKWVTYKLIDALTRAGISDDYIYVSFSGSKGYHVEIFFDDVVYNKDVEKFYLMILNEANLLNCEFGQVELRPLKGNGVKIPLGKHMKTNEICWYCDYENGLEQIKNYDYILNIKQLDRNYFYSLVNEENFDVTDQQAQEIENIVDKHKPLKIYKQNIDESYTLQSIVELYKNGLTTSGSRHNSLVKIAKFFKHHGLENEETKQELIKWMEWQDKDYYTSSWEEVLKDIDKICNSKYYDKFTLTIKNLDIEVTKSEIEEILKIKGKNEKLLLYSMLIHSKRYALKSGVFFMTYKQMMQSTGLSENTVIRLIKKLEELNYIEVYKSNKIIYNNKLNKPTTPPNKYKINLLSPKTYMEDKKFRVCDRNCTKCFNACLCNMYSDSELKKILSRRQYQDVEKYKGYCKKIAT